MNGKDDTITRYIFYGLVVGLFVLMFIAVFVNITHNDKDRDEAIREGYTVYLDGVEVDPNTIIIDKYGFHVDDENRYVLLNSGRW